MANRPAKFKVRRGTTAEWKQFDDAGYILEDGQFGYDTTLGQLKIGDGVSKFADIFAVGSTVGAINNPDKESFRVLNDEGSASFFLVSSDGRASVRIMDGSPLSVNYDTQALFRNIVILPAGSDPETHSAATSAPEGTLIFVKE